VPPGDLPNVTPDIPVAACKKFPKDFDMMKDAFESIFLQRKPKYQSKNISGMEKVTQPIAYVNKF
jgi:hypothetical protein